MCQTGLGTAQVLSALLDCCVEQGPAWGLSLVEAEHRLSWGKLRQDVLDLRASPLKGLERLLPAAGARAGAQAAGAAKCCPPGVVSLSAREKPRAVPCQELMLGF